MDTLTSPVPGLSMVEDGLATTITSRHVGTETAASPIQIGVLQIQKLKLPPLATTMTFSLGVVSRKTLKLSSHLMLVAHAAVGATATHGTLTTAAAHPLETTSVTSLPAGPMNTTASTTMKRNAQNATTSTHM